MPGNVNYDQHTLMERPPFNCNLLAKINLRKYILFVATHDHLDETYKSAQSLPAKEKWRERN